MITQLATYLDESENFYFINVTTGGYGITTSGRFGSLTYLCGLLNSRLLDFFFKRISTNFHGGYFAANKQFIEQLPIRSIDFDRPRERQQHDAIVELVRSIIAAKKRNPEADTTELENDVNRRVYALYDLNEEEVGLIETLKVEDKLSKVSAQ